MGLSHSSITASVSCLPTSYHYTLSLETIEDTPEICLASSKDKEQGYVASCDL